MASIDEVEVEYFLVYPLPLVSGGRNRIYVRDPKIARFMAKYEHVKGHFFLRS